MQELAQDRKRQEAWDKLLARRASAKVRKSSVPWPTVGKAEGILVAEGTVAVVAEGTVTDLLAQSEPPRPIKPRIHRASTRVRTDGSDDLGPINVPRRKGDGFMHYAVHERVQGYKLADGSEVKATRIRGDAWARARAPRIGREKLARLMMDRASLVLPGPTKGLGNGLDLTPRCETWRRLWDGFAPIWVEGTTVHKGMRLGFRLNRETGEIRPVH